MIFEFRFIKISSKNSTPNMTDIYSDNNEYPEPKRELADVHAIWNIKTYNPAKPYW